MTRKYFKDSVLDFGMFKGYELGLVYVFDPSYIDWCINNIDGFCVIDLDELLNYSVVNTELDVRIRMVNEPALIKGIDFFSSFQELIENLNIGDKKYIFNQETIFRNKMNLPKRRSFLFDDNAFADDFDNSNHCFVDDDPSVCEDVRQWEQDFARDNGFFPDGTGWRPDSI